MVGHLEGDETLKTHSRSGKTERKGAEIYKGTVAHPESGRRSLRFLTRLAVSCYLVGSSQWTCRCKHSINSAKDD
jgi:hypothetical protein